MREELDVRPYLGGRANVSVCRNVKGGSVECRSVEL